jgi:RNA polymerase sigma-70 factor (ECF subfamily)
VARVEPSSRARERGAAVADDALLAALREGDERIVCELVGRWSGAMLGLALVHTRSRPAAEDVVQDAWLTVLREPHRFEGRSALRTWVLGIVVNLARSRARADRRTVPVGPEAWEPAVEPARFRPPDAARWPDHWALGPIPWPAPEEALLATETREVLAGAVANLPSSQREVLVLRDVVGLTAAEACNVLRLTDTNQRVLLHRARSRVRNTLERYFDPTEPT